MFSNGIEASCFLGNFAKNAMLQKLAASAKKLREHIGLFLRRAGQHALRQSIKSFQELAVKLLESERYTFVSAAFVVKDLASFAVVFFPFEFWLHLKESLPSCAAPMIVNSTTHRCHCHPTVLNAEAIESATLKTPYLGKACLRNSFVIITQHKVVRGRAVFGHCFNCAQCTCH